MNNYKKIVFISSEFPPGPGGIGNHAYNLAQRFQLMGWLVTVITAQKNASEEEKKYYNEQLQFAIYQINKGSGKIQNFINDLLQIKKIINKSSPHVILSSGSRSVWLTILINHYFRLPWVIVAHGGAEFGTTNTIRRIINRWSYSRSNCVICVSEYTKKQLIGLGIHARNIQVITNGADEKSIYPINHELINRWKLQRGLINKHILLTVGSVTERKGQEIVIRALPKIRAEVGDVQYLMIGIPQRRKRLQELANNIGVSDCVHFIGKTDLNTLLNAYNACDIFLMTSLHSTDGDSEGFGIAVIEAALCGKPAVVSRQSGLAEAVIDRQTGLYVDEASVEDTAKAVIQILQSESLRTELGNTAQNLALERQTWTKKAKEYEAVLHNILGV